MRPLSPAPAPLPGALTLLQRLPGAAEAVLPVRLPTAARAARAGAQRDRDAAGRAAPEADGAGYAPLARVSIAAVGIVTPGRRCSSLHTNPACKPTPSGKYPACIHVLPCQVPTEPPTEPDPRGRLERHVPPSRVRPPPAGSAAPRPAWRSGGECENSSAPSAGATKSRHDHSSTGVGVPGGTAMRFDVGDRVLVHQQLVDSQQMHDAQQVCELVRAYVRPAGYDRPSMPMPTYLPTQAYDRRMASSHVSTDASSMFTNWQSRGAWGGTVERPPSLRALRLRRARPVALGVSTRPREKARRPSHCLGPRAGRLDRAPSGHPSPSGRTLLGVHPVAHPGGAPPACSRSTSSRSPTPCGTKTTAGSTTASTTAAWRRPMVSAPAPLPVAPPCSPRPSSGAGATARCNLPPCRACRARRHLRRCRRPDLSRRTLAASSPQCAWSATQARRGPTSRAHPWFLVAGG